MSQRAIAVPHTESSASAAGPEASRTVIAYTPAGA
jgi:hypothetical protein